MAAKETTVTLTPEELDKKIQQAVAAAMLNKSRDEKAEAERISKEREEAIKRQEEWLEERVPVQLFRDSDNYAAPKLVGINSHKDLIQRGSPAMVPRRDYLVLCEAEGQINVSADYAETKRITE